MTDTLRSDTATVVESGQSAISWAAIFAGGIAAAALTLVLLAFGTGMGFSAVSPWSNAGVCQHVQARNWRVFDCRFDAVFDDKRPLVGHYDAAIEIEQKHHFHDFLNRFSRHKFPGGA